MHAKCITFATLAFAFCTTGAFAQTAREIRGPAGVVPLASEEPPAKNIIDPRWQNGWLMGWSSPSTGPKTCGSYRCSARKLSMCRRASGTFM